MLCLPRCVHRHRSIRPHWRKLFMSLSSSQSGWRSAQTFMSVGLVAQGETRARGYTGPLARGLVVPLFKPHFDRSVG
jgi:hypothetical protein